jgi:hypothetical protein
MSSKTRSFLKRWRRRWAVKFRRLPLGTTIRDEEDNKKVFILPKDFDELMNSRLEQRGQAKVMGDK